MEQVRVFWTPTGVNLDQIGDKSLESITDGDTPKIVMDVRMLSIDTPEKNRTNRQISNVAELDDLFGQLAEWIKKGSAPLTEDAAKHFLPRLKRNKAASAHTQQGQEATKVFETLTKEKLERPRGKPRRLFVRISDSPFDRYGRLLAYVAPDYSAEEREKMSRADRATFNLMMVESGWAAPFIVYPNIPGELDLPLFRDAALSASKAKKGAYADSLALTGYEFRALERLAVSWKAIAKGTTVPKDKLWSWMERYAVDMTTRELYGPQGYVNIKPWNRIFVEPANVRRAVADLGLAAADLAKFGSITPT
jgi:endonuclease YncB( thermonuclease family)